MDTVRFGRVLGIGARHAARTLLQAADAAAAPNPRPHGAAAPPPSAPPVAARTRTAPSLPHLDRSRARHLGRSMFAPAVQAGRSLWFEFTGVFFGLFALVSTLAAWRLRGAWHSNPSNLHEHQQLLVSLAIAALFTWFCLSSFRRARRRSRP